MVWTGGDELGYRYVAVKSERSDGRAEVARNPLGAPAMKVRTWTARSYKTNYLLDGDPPTYLWIGCIESMHVEEDWDKTDGTVTSGYIEYG